ncbi:RNA polymerase sigma factor [Acidimangrovimonas pyrenivorans]|uniref:RNA polymerase sigma factor n=1 Tax=Acidimangrovimonas pyrenivorans TaxID=2030798 RepID=A0ABV7AMD0_9RHOB
MDADPWAEYARLQSMLGRTTNAYKAAGIEAAMTDLLERIGRGEVPNVEQVNNLIVNRTGKERRRRAMIHVGRDDISMERESCGVADAAESRLMLIKCAQACGPRDFSLLVRQAQGYTLAEVAEQTGAKVTTLKTRAHRARKLILALAA